MRPSEDSAATYNAHHVAALACVPVTVNRKDDGDADSACKPRANPDAASAL
jgi:hypothetical protein